MGLGLGLVLAVGTVVEHVEERDEELGRTWLGLGLGSGLGVRVRVRIRVRRGERHQLLHQLVVQVLG